MFTVKKVSALIVLFLCSFNITAQEAIIADHSIVSQYDHIPARWIDSVKTMLLSFPGASHGSAFIYGIELLAQQDSRFPAVVVWEGGNNVPPSPSTSHLRVFRPVRNYQNNGWVDRGGEEHFWTSETARTAMKNHITYFKNTLSNPISAFSYGWSYEVANGSLSGGWAGEVIVEGQGNVSPWDIATTSPNLNDYINAVSEYNNYDPSCVTFLLTGPVEGAYFSGERGYQAHLKYEAIRAAARANNGVLLDYADILSYNDAGNRETESWNGISYGYIHSDNEGNYNSGGNLNCHVSQGACLRLGKAIWWMLARIKGWDGNSGNNTSSPIMTPDAGTYYDSVRISMSCPTNGATIRYTTDGSVPTTSSDVYSQSILVTQTTNVQARAWANGLEPSSTTSATYTISEIQAVATPHLTPVGDTYRDSVEISISCETENAVIRYTLDGEDPTNNSDEYEGPFHLYETTTVKTRAFSEQMNPSEIEAAQYVISITPTAASVQFNPEPGTYSDSTEVTLSTSASSAIIRFTTDDSDPTETSEQYSAPIKITETTTIKARAWMEDHRPSDITSGIYSITETGRAAPPQINAESQTFTDSMLVTISSANDEDIIRFTLDGETPTTSSTIYEGPFMIYNSVTINAQVWAEDLTPSEVVSVTYFNERYIEAETATLNGAIIIENNDEASGGAYITAITAEEGSATITIDIETAGRYAIFARVYAPTEGRNSFYYSIDESDSIIWDIQEVSTSWGWKPVSARGEGTFDNPEFDTIIVNLSAGEHSLVFYGRESSTFLDAIQLTHLGEANPVLINENVFKRSKRLSALRAQDFKNGKNQVEMYNLKGRLIKGSFFNNGIILYRAPEKQQQFHRYLFMK